MHEIIRLGRGRELTNLPRQMWESHLAEVPAHGESRLSFMSEDHHRVRYFVVEALVRTGRPLEPAHIGQALHLSLAQTNNILDELEQNLFFLFRNEAGAVSWAYPVTVDETPHRITFSSGEQLYAA